MVEFIFREVTFKVYNLILVLHNNISILPYFNLKPIFSLLGICLLCFKNPNTKEKPVDKWRKMNHFQTTKNIFPF